MLEFSTSMSAIVTDETSHIYEAFTRLSTQLEEERNVKELSTLKTASHTRLVT